MSDEEDFLEDEWEINYDDGFGAQADDLAEHSLPSPPYMGYESDMDNMNDSDMEDEVLEYLDFYYDDDPSLMKAKHGRDGHSSPRKKRKAEEIPRARKKRKTEQEHPFDSQRTLVAAKPRGHGIVWKAEDRNGPPLYEPGNGEKVALLKDWRKLVEDTSKDLDVASKPKLVVKARQLKKKDLDADDAPRPDRPLKVPQLAKGHRSRRRRSSPKPSPLKHSISSSDLPTISVNGPKKKTSPSVPDHDTEQKAAAGQPATKKRRNSGNGDDETIHTKRRAVSGKEKDDKELENGWVKRQTRSRTAAKN